MAARGKRSLYVPLLLQSVEVRADGLFVNLEALGNFLIVDRLAVPHFADPVFLFGDAVQEPEKFPDGRADLPAVLGLQDPVPDVERMGWSVAVLALVVHAPNSSASSSRATRSARAIDSTDTGIPLSARVRIMVSCPRKMVSLSRQGMPAPSRGSTWMRMTIMAAPPRQTAALLAPVPHVSGACSRIPSAPNDAHSGRAALPSKRSARTAGRDHLWQHSFCSKSGLRMQGSD